MINLANIVLLGDRPLFSWENSIIDGGSSNCRLGGSEVKKSKILENKRIIDQKLRFLAFSANPVNICSVNATPKNLCKNL